MSAADLGELAATADLMPPCPVKAVEHERLNVFAPVSPILPVPAQEPDGGPRPDPRRWEYRVC